MGGFSTILTALSPLSKILGGAFDTYKSTDAYHYARAAYNAQEKQIQQDAENQRKQLALESEKDEADRRDALKRALAKQKAAFGAQGIDTSDGSGQSVLLGLLQESDEDQNYNNRLNRLKRTALAQQTDQKRQRNLLSLQNSYASARNNIGDTFLGAL